MIVRYAKLFVSFEALLQERSKFISFLKSKFPDQTNRVGIIGINGH